MVELVEEFVSWYIKEPGNSLETCRDCARHLRRPLDPRNPHSVKAYKPLRRILSRDLRGSSRFPRAG